MFDARLRALVSSVDSNVVVARDHSTLTGSKIRAHHVAAAGVEERRRSE
jgi:hypothetical protein